MIRIHQNFLLFTATQNPKTCQPIKIHFNIEHDLRVTSIQVVREITQNVDKLCSQITIKFGNILYLLLTFWVFRLRFIEYSSAYK